MLSLAVPLLFMSLLGFKLKLPYGLLMGLIILTLLLGWLGNVSLLPVLVVLFFMSPLLLATKRAPWQSILFGVGCLLPQLVQFVMLNQRWPWVEPNSAWQWSPLSSMTCSSSKLTRFFPIFSNDRELGLRVWTTAPDHRCEVLRLNRHWRWLWHGMGSAFVESDNQYDSSRV